jgi:hypothetical protein
VTSWIVLAQGEDNPKPIVAISDFRLPVAIQNSKSATQALCSSADPQSDIANPQSRHAALRLACG